MNRIVITVENGRVQTISTLDHPLEALIVTLDAEPNTSLPFDGPRRPAHVEWIATNTPPLPDERAWIEAN